MNWPWKKNPSETVAGSLAYTEAMLDDVNRRCAKVAEMVVQWHVRKTPNGETLGRFTDMFGRESREICLTDLRFREDAREMLKEALGDLRVAAPEPKKEETK